VSLHGHLFDTGLINKAFDLLEENHARFHLIHCEVHPNLRAKVEILKRAICIVCNRKRESKREFDRKACVFAPPPLQSAQYIYKVDIFKGQLNAKLAICKIE